MTTQIEQNLIAYTQGRVDTNYLHGVQEGFGGLGVGISMDLFLTLLVTFAVILLVLLVLYRWLKPSMYRLSTGKEDLIEDPSAIKDIINRSITQRATYDIEVFDRNYKEIYKGQALLVESGGDIQIGISSFMDPSLDFRQKQIRVAFRMSRLGRQEFYQFNSLSVDIGHIIFEGRKERSLRISMPKQMEVSQKRRYVRIEPEGRFRFKVRIMDSAAAGDVQPLNAFSTLHVTDINDVSIGGLQSVIVARAGELKIKPNEEVYIHFKPSCVDLDLENPIQEIFARVRILSIYRQQTGRRVMSRQADERTPGPNIIRMMFTARAHINRKEKTATFRPASSVLFEDLARWIQAYQRYRIQEDKGTKPQRDKIHNLYPSKKPDRGPKPPAQPPKRAEKEQAGE